jgi:hypothetical protein
MPDPEFSEFQFAYSVTRELESKVFPSGSIPHFPTQNQEADRGYDLNFSNGVSSLFIQYKRSKRLDDGRAKDKQWNTYGDRFYRFKLRTSDDRTEPEQHEILTRLAQRDSPVYYVAPEFVEWMDYQQFARNSAVLQHSAFIDCENAPTPFDGDRHYVCHRPEDPVARFFSEEPRTMNRLDAKETSSRLTQVLIGSPPQFNSFEEATSEFREIRENITEEMRMREQINPSDYTADDQSIWIREQQRFFEEILGISAHFFETG